MDGDRRTATDQALVGLAPACRVRVGRVLVRRTRQAVRHPPSWHTSSWARIGPASAGLASIGQMPARPMPTDSGNGRCDWHQPVSGGRPCQPGTGQACHCRPAAMPLLTGTSRVGPANEQGPAGPWHQLKPRHSTMPGPPTRHVDRPVPAQAGGRAGSDRAATQVTRPATAVTTPVRKGISAQPASPSRSSTRQRGPANVHQLSAEHVAESSGAVVAEPSTYRQPKTAWLTAATPTAANTCRNGACPTQSHHPTQPLRNGNGPPGRLQPPRNQTGVAGLQPSQEP